MDRDSQFPIKFYPSFRVIGIVTVSALLVSAVGLVRTISGSNYVWLILVGPCLAVSLVGVLLMVRRSPSAILERDHLTFRRGIKYVRLLYSDLDGLTRSDPGVTGRLVLSTRNGHTIEWGQASFRESLSAVGERISELTGIDLHEEGT
jgi:hypothetical protein